MALVAGTDRLRASVSVALVDRGAFGPAVVRSGATPSNRWRMEYRGAFGGLRSRAAPGGGAVEA